MSRLAFLLFAVSVSAHAQYGGPGVETCRKYAESESRKFNPGISAVSIEKDRDLVIERYTQKVGSQFVSSVLSGNGAIVLAGAPSTEFAFVCLLADEKRAVFFHWLPRRDAPALAQCRRGGGDPGPCLDVLLQIAEQELVQRYAEQYAGGNADAFRPSAEAWKAYREAECARRGESDARKACLVELTRRRALDLP